MLSISYKNGRKGERKVILFLYSYTQIKHIYAILDIFLIFIPFIFSSNNLQNYFIFFISFFPSMFHLFPFTFIVFNRF